MGLYDLSSGSGNIGLDPSGLSTPDSIYSLGGGDTYSGGSDGFYGLDYAYADTREAAKLDPYVAAPNGDTRPWWERVAEYGLSRAIDSHFGPPATNKTSAPATFAGQNGVTYSQVGGQPAVASGGGNWLPLVIAGAVALVALS